MKLKIDYKGKYFILQDKIFEEGFDYEIGNMKDEEITDEFLKSHIENCVYYGIPPYIGDDKNLKDRIEKIYKNIN